MRVIIYDDNGDELESFDVKQSDFQFNVQNDLEPVVSAIGDVQPPYMYSKGFFFNLSGYSENPNIEEDYHKALELQAKEKIA